MTARNIEMDFRIDANGYELLTLPDRKGQQLKWHIILAEKALGRALPKGALVHHANEIRHDNRLSNLVICPDEAYHHLLHQRLRAKKACGHASWLKCHYCQTYDDPQRLYVLPNKRKGYHRECINKYNREYKAQNYEKVKAYHLNYQKQNETHIKELGRKYWELNKDKINAKRRKN